MIIGIDFDNTIIHYGTLFHQVGVELGYIDESVPTDKTSVRDYLRSIGHNDWWTFVQGEVYGNRLSDAQPAPGFMEFFTRSTQEYVSTIVSSHRTCLPAAGPKYDLHKAAAAWLADLGILDIFAGVWFNETRQKKIEIIRETACDWFIDDLPEVFEEPSFPAKTKRILYNPSNLDPAEDLTVCHSWSEISELIFA